MKKIILSLLTVSLSTIVFSQEAADKKIQAGLILGTGLNMQQMGTKNVVKNGIGSDLSIGANINFSFTNTIGFTTGVEFDFSRMNFKSASGTNLYYGYDDTKILRKDEITTDNSIFELHERNQRVTYLTVPTMLLFRTNYIGYFRYFGKFGLKNSFMLGSKSFDKGVSYSPNTLVAEGTTHDNDAMKMKTGTDIFFYRGSVGLAGGAEWNFSGATCLVAEIGYYYGFTPLFYGAKEEKKSLYTSTSNGVNPPTVSYINNVAKQSQLMLKVSILF